MTVPSRGFWRTANIMSSSSGSIAPKVPVISPPCWPVVCDGLSVGAWLKNVRRIVSHAPCRKSVIGLDGNFDNTLVTASRKL